MSDTRFFLDNLWRWKCGLPEEDYEQKKENVLPSYDELKKTEWSPEFEKLMRNRLIMGAYRYGRIHESNKPNYDRTSSIEKRLNKYRETGNVEFLVDIANLCLLEFEVGNHPNKHFQSIDDGEHVTVK